jgi:hypothetical protein
MPSDTFPAASSLVRTVTDNWSYSAHLSAPDTLSPSVYGDIASYWRDQHLGQLIIDITAELGTDRSLQRIESLLEASLPDEWKSECNLIIDRIMDQ